MRISYFLAASACISSINAVDPVVNLSYSKYEGTALPNGVSQWLGIRYAAPPLGHLRFSAPSSPIYNETVQQANKHGALCLANQNGPGLQYNSPRQPMDEDCLFVDVYAPTNATTSSNLPVMVFIQGGGWTSNSNGNFNGSLLVQNSGYAMMVVTLNYRVGLLGALASKEVLAAGSLNNGLKDVMYALQWVQDRADQFGGNIHHVVLSGDSVGAIIIGYLMAAHNGTGLPGFFHAAAAESTSVSGDAQVVDLQPQYDALVNATGCSNSTDTLSCLRTLGVTDLQTKSPVYTWSPCIDHDILHAPLYEMYEARRFRQVPVIYGSCTDEGTTLVDKSVTTQTLDAALRKGLGSVNETVLNEVKNLYPESLNNVTFSGAVLNATYPGAGNEWQRLSAIYGETFLRCVAAFQSDMHFAAGNIQNWHYHYDVLDPRDASTGKRVYHTAELNAIWGPNNTDGSPPPSYYISNDTGGNAGAVPIMQSYWISFVLTFDPNKLRNQTYAKWESWTISGSKRLLFHSNETRMERMSAAERDRCKIMMPYAKARGASTPSSALQPFANGTFSDPYPVRGYTSLPVVAKED